MLDNSPIINGQLSIKHPTKYNIVNNGPFNCYWECKWLEFPNCLVNHARDNATGNVL